MLVGDLNVAPDRDSYDPVGLKDTIHHTVEGANISANFAGMGLTGVSACSSSPRRAIRGGLPAAGLSEEPRPAPDHILVGEALRAGVTACRIDRAPSPQPSDHARWVATLG